ncbi:hypothetical protein QBC47DRAFT_390785, partial [Echria macrotheca]
MGGKGVVVVFLIYPLIWIRIWIWVLLAKMGFHNHDIHSILFTASGLGSLFIFFSGIGRGKQGGGSSMYIYLAYVFEDYYIKTLC